MRILFIARTYPPTVGGLEQFASDFYTHLKKTEVVDLLANPGGKKTLFVFALKVFFYILRNAKNYDVVHFNDALLDLFIPVIRLVSRARVTFTVHGLDVVYGNFGYQRLIPTYLRKADRIFPVSQHTLEQCQARGIPKSKMTVIPNGINFDVVHPCSKLDMVILAEKFRVNTEGKKFLLSIGRLIKRKGHLWFLVNVFPLLADDYVYLIAGQGPEEEVLSRFIREKRLGGRVHLVGRVNDHEKNCLMQMADLFIMPNIHVKGDVEGFGIVLIEAGANGLPVIASNIEGIKDAVIDGRTGRLIEEKDVQGFLDAIISPGIDRSSIKAVISDNFNWKNNVQLYTAEFNKLIHSGRTGAGVHPVDQS